MKNNLILGVAIVSMLFSCTTDDTADIIINDNKGNDIIDDIIINIYNNKMIL